MSVKLLAPGLKIRPVQVKVVTSLVFVVPREPSKVSAPVPADAGPEPPQFRPFDQNHGGPPVPFQVQSAWAGAAATNNPATTNNLTMRFIGRSRDKLVLISTDASQGGRTILRTG